MSRRHCPREPCLSTIDPCKVPEDPLCVLTCSKEMVNLRGHNAVVPEKPLRYPLSLRVQVVQHLARITAVRGSEHDHLAEFRQLRQDVDCIGTDVNTCLRSVR
jgi:hypothetical protein